jgi:hypothetical protein
MNNETCQHGVPYPCGICDLTDAELRAKLIQLTRGITTSGWAEAIAELSDHEYRAILSYAQRGGYLNLAKMMEDAR